MKREINFRGKRKDGKGWIYGYYQRLVVHGIMRYFIVPANSLVFDDVKFIDVLIEIIPETVSQFTGLKDKNRKEIYEGDIVKTKMNHICEIRWDKVTESKFDDHDKITDVYQYTGFCLFNIKLQRCYHLDYPEKIEIIGNIHDNPELLTNNLNKEE